MKKNLYLKYSLLLLLGAVLLSSCGKDAAPVLYDEYTNHGTPTPVVNSISPTDSAWGGYDTLTIAGTNFSQVTTNNIVWFDNVEAPVVAATPTQLKVILPHYPKDSVKIRVDVTTAHEYAQLSKPFRIKPVQVTAWNLALTEVPAAMTVDKDGNIYSFIKSSGSGTGIQKEDANKNITQFVPQAAGYDWKSLKFGPGGLLYATRGLTAIWRTGQTDKAPATWVTRGQGISGNILDLDFDAQGNAWAGGTGKLIFRITQAKTVTNFAITADTVQAVRVFNNYVYIAGKKDSTEEKIWRYALSGDGLGQEEVYFDFLAKYPGDAVTALTFANDGTMLIGTSSAINPIIMVSTSGQISGVLPVTGVIKGFVNSISTYGNYLYYSRNVTDKKDSDQKIFRVNMFKPMAPYLGRNL